MGDCVKNKIIDDLATGNSNKIAMEHIQNCSYCSARLKEAKDFWNRFQKELNSPTTKREHELLDWIDPPPRTWIAKPIFEDRSHYKTDVLAAATSTEITQQNVSRVGVLATDNQGILIRVLHYKSTGKTILYFLSDDPNKMKKVGVRIPQINFTGVTNQYGELDIGSVNLDQWTDWSVEIQSGES